MKIIRVGVKFVTGWRWACWPWSLYPTHAQLGSMYNHKRLCWSGRSMCLEDSFSVPVKSAYFPFSFSSQFSRPIQADSMILLDFTTFGTYQYAQQSASVFVRSFYKVCLLWQKQETFMLVPEARVSPIMVGKSQLQEPDTAGHIALAVPKRWDYRACDGTPHKTCFFPPWLTTHCCAQIYLLDDSRPWQDDHQH